MEWDELLRNHEYDCIGAVLIDTQANVRAASDGVVELSGFPRDHLLSINAVELLHPDDVERGIEVLAEVHVTPGTRADGMYRLRLATGEYQSFSLRAINLGTDFQDAVVLRISGIDARTRVTAEAFAEDVVDATRMLCQSLSLAEWFDWASRVGERHVAGLQLIITVLHEEAQNHVHSRGEIPAEMLAANLAATADELPAHVQASLDEHNRGPWLAPNRVATRDSLRPDRLTSILLSSTGAISGYIELLRPTTAAPPESEWLLHAMITRVVTAALQRYELDRQLRWAAEHDPLTGLFNRRKLIDAMEQQGTAGSFLFLIDLDQFSAINNTFGHQMGDEVLVGVAASLEAECPSDAMIVRIGGDEFVVWIPTPPAGMDLETQGQQLRESLRYEIADGDQQAIVRSSIGAVMAPEGDTPAQVIGRADTAMYASKDRGGDMVTIDG